MSKQNVTILLSNKWSQNNDLIPDNAFTQKRRQNNEKKWNNNCNSIVWISLAVMGTIILSILLLHKHHNQSRLNIFAVESPKYPWENSDLCGSNDWNFNGLCSYVNGLKAVFTTTDYIKSQSDVNTAIEYIMAGEGSTTVLQSGRSIPLFTNKNPIPLLFYNSTTGTILNDASAIDSFPAIFQSPSTIGALVTAYGDDICENGTTLDRTAL